MESRNSYGWGSVGSNKKGFEWLLVYGRKAHEKMRSGYVYKTEEEALEEGRKYQDESNCEPYKKGKLEAVKAEPLHFAY